MTKQTYLWQIEAPVGNYYGSPRVTAWSDGTFTFEIENWDGWPTKEEAEPVTKAFAAAWKRQFGPKKTARA